MYSLIVALPSSAVASGALRFALTREAAPGLQQAYGEVNADGVVVDHGSAPLALLPRAAELVAVVPAHKLSWHRVTLPRVNSARLRSALDGLLEDRLLDDPSALHFSLAPGASPGEAMWVAACDKAWLQQALQGFEAAGRPVSRVVPEYTPAPSGEAPVWHAIGSPEHAQLVRCADDGVQLLALVPDAREALAPHPAATGDAAERAETDGGAARPPCFADPAVSTLAEQVLGGPVMLVHGAQRLVASARSTWDLAQFDLASTGRTRLVRRVGLAWAQWMSSPEWRPARWALVILLLAHLGGLNAWAWKERSALEAKRTEVRQLLTKTFPRVPVVVDAPAQMENEVAAMRQATGAVSPRDLEPMLAVVAEHARTARPPIGLEFSRGQLTLKGFQPPDAEVPPLLAALGAAGYGSETEGTNWLVRPRAASTAVKTASGARP